MCTRVCVYMYVYMCVRTYIYPPGFAHVVTYIHWRIFRVYVWERWGAGVEYHFQEI